MYHSRAGEVRNAEVISLFESGKYSSSDIESSLLQFCCDQNIRVALIGIPEDIGVRANYGRSGARDAWRAFLNSFLNFPGNPDFDMAHCALLGEVDLALLLRKSDELSPVDPEYFSELRKICAQVDDLVAPVVESLVAKSVIPLLIGGGHNNAYPAIKGAVHALRGKGVTGYSFGCVNIDAHADLRMKEGRHSGNGFSFAIEEKLLDRYCVIGLQEATLSQKLREQFSRYGQRYVSFEELMIRNSICSEVQLKEALEWVVQGSNHYGLEVDLDCIADMPSSARSPYGFSVTDVARLIYRIVTVKPPAYIHFSEGAPSLGEDGDRQVGRALAFLVSGVISVLLKK
jgi:formiminoglutamase